jgi:hypothetical protein
MSTPASLAKAADWLCRANDPDINSIGRDLQRWLAGGARERIGQALGLERAGGTSPRYGMALAERNRMLRAVRSTKWPDLEPGAAARAMLADFGAYEARRWPREQLRLDAPAGEPAATWWRILRAGVKMPGRRRLTQLLAMEIHSPI